MALLTIEKVEAWLVRLEPPILRTDAIQSFVAQETPIVKITASDGSVGCGYSYTIGTGGSAVMKMLQDHLMPRLIGQNPDRIEAIWQNLHFYTHATQVGAITSLSLAAIDIALWDRRALKLKLPLWQMLGGAKEAVPVYTTEGGWLHLSSTELIEQTLGAKSQGFHGAKVKIGKNNAKEDFNRISALRNAVGEDFILMVDANQSLKLDQALKRAYMLAELDLAWLEEPLPADNLVGHQILAGRSPIAIAIGESLYSAGQFGDYMHNNACHLVQVDVARVGGITPWLKVAAMAEVLNLVVCPHFLMELHVSLCCAKPSTPWLEYIPQLDPIITHKVLIKDGKAFAPTQPGLGIEWNWSVIENTALVHIQCSK